MPILIEKYIQSLRHNDEMLEQMINSRKRVDPVFDPTFDMVFVFDKECKYMFANFMVANRMRIRTADMEGKHWRELGIPADIMELVEETVKRVFDTQEIIVKNLSFVNPGTGEVNHHETSFSPLYDSQGNCCAVYNIAKDVTERVKAETQLSRQTQLFAELISKAPQAIVVVDTGETIIYCNSEAAKLLSKTSAEGLIGRPISNIAEVLGFPYEKMIIVKTLRNKEVLERHQKLAGKDLLVSTFPLLDSSGGVLAGVVLMQDITQTMAIQEELRKIDCLNVVGQMAAGVAHEIRNPLTVVKGYLQFLERKIPSEINERFQLVLAELARIEDIISSFLAIASKDETRRELRDLNQIIKELLPLITADAITRSIDVKVDLEEDMPPILLNKQELKQILLNLSRNGVEAMQDNGILTIKTKMDQDGMLLAVLDSGIGMSQEVVDNIFNPFYTTKKGGSGLGLAICQNIMLKYKWKMTVHSEEGKGSSFTVRFQ